MSSLYILIPLLPLLAALIIALGGHRLGESCRKVGTLAIGFSFAFSVVALIDLAIWGQPHTIPLYQLLRSGSLEIDLCLYIDQLSVLVLLLVTGVSFVVHAYSSRYMIGDVKHSRFFAVMSLFTFAMITLVMSSNLMMMFIGWELMGICSYLLISHQSDRKAACDAATKAFLVNAVADVGLLFGIVLTYTTFGTLDIQQIILVGPSIGDQTINLLGAIGYHCPVRTMTLITLLLFTGCLGKSAQVPFHVWLPQAMEAPTPVSALIHAATMVNAGPFLLIRLSPLVMLSPTGMTVIAVVGGATALFAAVVSLTQTDVKKILAYSTISQIGFMIMTCGLGAFVAATFHLLAHGLLKGYLFLSTGSQLDPGHGHGTETNTSSSPPWQLYAGALVLACVAPLVLFSGPYGNLWTTHPSPAAGIAFSVLGLLTVFFASMYCVRGVTMLFQHGPRPDVVPRFFSLFHLLVVPAGTCVMVGLLFALWSWFVPFLLPALGIPELLADAGNASTNGDAWQPFSQIPLLVTALLVAIGGWGIACVMPQKWSVFSLVPAGIRESLYILFLNRFYFDEAYETFIVSPAKRTSKWLWRMIDVGVVDRFVVQSGLFCVAIAAWLWRTVDVRGMEGAGVRTESEVASGSGKKSADGASGIFKRDVSARPVEHQLLIQILWLIAVITFFYWLVLSP